MAEYVLVGGAWLGGWCWRPVARRLRDNGHEAYPATLTGLGERAHLASPEVDLETHVTDVVNLIEYEGLCDVVLVGHSYGGLVVTGAADRVPGRVSRLVYLDTTPLPDGGALFDKFPPELRRREREAGKGAGRGLEAPDAAPGGVGRHGQPRRAGRRLAGSAALPGHPAAVRHLHPAFAAYEPRPRGAAQARDSVQLLAGPNATDDRRRTPASR
jgi:pimeloyl-ACP methyl ester carboxylesterase